MHRPSPLVPDPGAPDPDRPLVPWCDDEQACHTLITGAAALRNNWDTFRDYHLQEINPHLVNSFDYIALTVADLAEKVACLSLEHIDKRRAQPGARNSP